MTRAFGILLSLFALPVSFAVQAAEQASIPSMAEGMAEKRFQDFVRDVWSLEAGLPQITVSTIAQGPEGYIWVGTQQGLARFDGVRFTTFTPDRASALPGSYIQSLHTDSRDRLWVGTYKGVALYHKREFHPVPGPPGPDGLAMELNVLAIAETPQGEILVGAEEGLFRVRDRRLEPLRLPEPDSITAIYPDNGVMMLGAIGRYWQYDGQNFSTATALPEDRRSARILDFARHADALWIATSAGAFRHDGDALQPVNDPDWLPSQPVTALFRDANDTLWVAADRALLRYRGGRLFEEIDPGHPNAHRQIQSMAQDHEGSLWLGSFRDGLARYWSGWTERFNEPQGLHEPLVWSVADAGDGDVWVGTNDGLSRLHDGRYRLVVPGAELPHPHAYTLHVGPEGLWIGTRQGLTILDPESGELRVPEALRALDAYQINGVIPAGPHGRYFFTTTQGLHLLDDTGRLRRISDRIGSRHVRQLRLEANGNLLVATNSGLFAGHPRNLVRLDDRVGLDPGADYAAIHRLDAETVVVSTIDAGLYVGRRGQWHHLTTEQGLPTNASYFVTDDGEAHLWVAGFHGLYRLPLQEILAVAAGERRNVNAEMILSESGRHIGSQQAFCCNGAGHAKGLMRADGLWLPTRGGAVRIRPDGIERNPYPPVTLVERVRFDHAWHELLPDQSLNLPLGSRDLEFEFTALSFQDPRSVRLRFRLAGYDQQWRDLENVFQRSAAYTNLPPGDYRFEVQAANNAGVWTENGAGMPFTVPPRFHETLWFQAVPVALAILLFLLGYRWRVSQLRRRQVLLEQEVQERTEQLRVSNNRLVEANRALRDASQTDALTGLRNRRYLYGQMARDLAHFERIRDRLPEDDLVLVFALVDVDHFKRINDELGHRSGDLVLRQFGDRLESIVRTGDYVVRWGGEEFLVVFREMRRDCTETIVSRLQDKLQREPYRVDERDGIRVTASVGFAEYPLRPESEGSSLSWEALVDLADHALYQVKRNGRNGWATLRPGREKDPIEFLRTVRTDLEPAISDGRVLLRGSWIADRARAEAESRQESRDSKG
ncbi:ligand-binding sensor domain-containing diguanylate cyclase [Natronospira bacteriovora]|uniref:diguanylate cyclase n=1 Tax=Natronospira bacteriovora TaxID=3069753 RepID=A0ABU0W6Z4_9GAMM|nr:ligand-binding sensor domain-containing diguanylate cyclase [Natronospira sp. AB-CW4]MDQ2069771.1 diguanylate cyclase [Natronospira sp. AB-CW4]